MPLILVDSIKSDYDANSNEIEGKISSTTDSATTFAFKAVEKKDTQWSDIENNKEITNSDYKKYTNDILNAKINLDNYTSRWLQTNRDIRIALYANCDNALYFDSFGVKHKNKTVITITNAFQIKF